MNFKGIDLKLCDMSLHDLMYLRPGQLRLDDLVAVARALDAAGVPLIEIGAGETLGTEPREQAEQCADMEACLRAIVPGLKQARVAVRLTAGAAATEQLQRAHHGGVTTVCIAARWLDASLVAPYLRFARRLGLDTVGMLMMAPDTEVEVLVRQARIMEAEGASCITLADSLGAMFGADVRTRLQALREALDPQTVLGFHGHANTASAVSNSLAAIEGGARRIEGSLVLPGIGHTPIDVLCAVCNRMGGRTGVDAYQLSDIGEGLVQPLIHAYGLFQDSRPGAPSSVVGGEACKVERRGQQWPRQALA